MRVKMVVPTFGNLLISIEVISLDQAPGLNAIDGAG
jgi:hypothetical protein